MQGSILHSSRYSLEKQCTRYSHLLIQLVLIYHSLLYKVQNDVQCDLFKEAWNSVPTGVEIVGDCVEDEWVWVLPWLVIACETAVHSVARVQFDEKEDEEILYVEDNEDFEKTYYLVGVVWSAIKKFFSSSVRVGDAIGTMFLEKSDAVKAGLPTREVNSK